MKKYASILCAFLICLISLNLSAASENAKQLVGRLTPSQKEVLTAYFRCALMNIEGAASIFGGKPIWLRAFPTSSGLNNKIVSSYIFNWMDATTWQIWESLNVDDSNASMKIVVSPAHLEDHGGAYVHLMWINRDALKDTIAANLDIFQALLGANLSGEDIINLLEHPPFSLHRTLRNNQILVGLVLGYGKKNALMGGHSHNLSEVVNLQDQLPYRQRFEREGLFNLSPEYCDYTLGSYVPDTEQKSIRSPCYGSLHEEWEAMNALASLSIYHPLAQQGRCVHFGTYEEGGETDEIIQRYVAADAMAEQLLALDNFLEEVLTYFVSPDKTEEMS